MPFCDSITGYQIATHFCTYHDSIAVAPYAKFCSDHFVRIEMNGKRNFLRNLLAMAKKNTPVKRAPGSCLCSLSIRHALRWRHNEHDSVSNHQPRDCLLNRLFRRRSKKTSKLRVTGLCVGNSPGTGEFPAQMASNAEKVSIWWRHHGMKYRWAYTLLDMAAYIRCGQGSCKSNWMDIYGLTMHSAKPIRRRIMSLVPIGQQCLHGMRWQAIYGVWDMALWAEDITVRLTHWGREKWTPFSRRHFQMHFLEWKCLIFD